MKMLRLWEKWRELLWKFGIIILAKTKSCYSTVCFFADPEQWGVYGQPWLNGRHCRCCSWWCHCTGQFLRVLWTLQEKCLHGQLLRNLCPSAPRGWDWSRRLCLHQAVSQQYPFFSSTKFQYKGHFSSFNFSSWREPFRHKINSLERKSRKLVS